MFVCARMCVRACLRGCMYVCLPYLSNFVLWLLAIATSSLRHSTCELGGLVRVFTQADNQRRSCNGTLSDWSEGRDGSREGGRDGGSTACGSKGRLRVHLRGVCSATDKWGSNSTRHILQGIRYTLASYKTNNILFWQ